MIKRLCSFIIAVAVVFPIEGGYSLKAWMMKYERYLYAQMEANFRHEQKTMEEEDTRSCLAGGTGEGLEEGSSKDEYTQPTENNEQAVVAEEAPEILEDVQAGPEATMEREVAPVVILYPKYSVDGAVLDYGVQEYLYVRLCEAGIGWFFPYALMIAYQESRFDPLAENPNGRDKGLFQYRVEYHPTLDWRNPYAETDIFVAQMTNRANAGCDTLTMISRHKQSDWGPYDPEYVAQVLQWEGRLVQIQ